MSLLCHTRMPRLMHFCAFILKGVDKEEEDEGNEEEKDKKETSKSEVSFFHITYMYI